MKTTEARKLLGIGPEASPEAIKKAFRHLAMKWHPDRNAAPGAGEFFARLNAACEQLLSSHPHTRSTRKTSAQDEKPEKPSTQGEDRFEDIHLTIEQICLGGMAEVSIKSAAECDICLGKGFHESDHSQLCSHCQGSGRVRVGRILTPCDDCNGRGYTRRARCPQCDGKGKIITQRKLTVTVPPGVLPGDELRLEGEGHRPESGKGKPGNLRLRIQLSPHPLYTLDGTDIVLERPVSAFTLLGGGTVVVPAPDGPHYLDIEPGPATAREQIIIDAGIPARGKRTAGQLRVRLVPVLPTTTSPALLKLYHALQDEIERAGPQALPEVVAWQKRWL